MPLYPYTRFTATIANAATESGHVNLKGHTLLGIYIPVGFEGTTITFEASPDDGATWLPVHDEDGNELTLTVAAGTFVKIDPSLLCGVDDVKLIVSAQTGSIILTLATRPLT
jgi:hypothetical protein